MYTEDYKREDFPYKNFLLKFVIIIIVVSILVCIVTAVTKNNKEIEPEGYVDEVFSKNLEKMKEKALKFYNEDNIPKDVEKSSKLTLEKMISSKIITPIKDKDNKLCNTNKSYVKLTKKENEYQLKVNLVCDEEEDYIITHLNNNSYCSTTYLCENKSNDVEDSDKEELSIEEQDDDTESNLLTSSKTTTKQNKNISISKTKKVRKTKVTSKKSTGQIIVTDTTNKYLYEYKKISNTVFSNWSLWNNWTTTDCNTKEINCDEKDITCVRELKRLDRKEKLNIYNTYTSTKSSLKNNSTIKTSVCSNYDYIKIDNEIYQLNNSNDYRQINNITKNTKNNVGSWIYNGRASYDTPPTDTYNVHYILVDADYSNCSNTCNKLPKYIYDKYTYNNSLIKVSNYTCNKNKTFEISIYNRVNETITFGRNEELYGTVCYKSERTRDVISNSTNNIKWSKYNDKRLLNDGYYYTGNKKKK